MFRSARFLLANIASREPVKSALISGLLGSVLLWGLSAGCSPSALSAPSKPYQATLESILRATSPAQADYFYLRKIDSHLQGALIAYLSGGDAIRAAQASGLQVNDKNEVQVDIYVTGPVSQAAAQLGSMGMTVQATNEAMGVVEGPLPMDVLLPVARLDFTKSLMAVTALRTNNNLYPNPYPNP